MLFQESTVKEFLEKNLRREAPMFEGDETLILDEWLNNNDLYKIISLSRLENRKWVLKGNNSLKMALKTYPIMQNLYMELKATSIMPFDQHSLNIDSLTKANNQARQNTLLF